MSDALSIRPPIDDEEKRFDDGKNVDVITDQNHAKGKYTTDGTEGVDTTNVSPQFGHYNNTNGREDTLTPEPTSTTTSPVFGLPGTSKGRNVYLVPETTSGEVSRASSPGMMTPRDPSIWTAGSFQPAQPMYPQGPYQTVTWNKADNDVVVSRQPPGTVSSSLADIEWTEDPTPCVCPKCKRCILSQVYFQTGTCTYVSCVGLCLVGCDAGCCLAPFFMDRFKDAIHSCPKCRSHLGMYKRFC